MKNPSWLSILFLMALCWPVIYCTQTTRTDKDTLATTINVYVKGSFGYDLQWMRPVYPNLVILRGKDSTRQVLVSPGHQGRVMTSTAGGLSGQSFGWLNYDLLASRKILEHITPIGGEERIWLGPEGGQFSIYFKPGSSFEYANWQVPREIDSEPFDLESQSDSFAVFSKTMHLQNYTGTRLDLNLRRKIRILEGSEVEKLLDLTLPGNVKWVGFESENILTNIGQEAWNRKNGMLSVWILSMLTPSPSTTVVVPFRGRPQDIPELLTDDYFGKVPADRLKVKDNCIFFRADGRYRSKIGISPRGALPIAGSYDAENNVLTIAQFSLPEGKTEYVNSLWKIQENPFEGDAVNAYNDGPVADGSQMGPFYEIESSSPAAALAPLEKLVHYHRTFHFKGPMEDLDQLATRILGVRLDSIKTAFGR